MPKHLSDSQKMVRSLVRTELLTNYHADPDYLSKIVTGDESLFHCYEPDNRLRAVNGVDLMHYHPLQLFKESGDFFYYGNNEFLIYCYIYQFIPCKMAGWGKLSEKPF